MCQVISLGVSMGVRNAEALRLILSGATAFAGVDPAGSESLLVQIQCHRLPGEGLDGLMDCPT